MKTIAQVMVAVAIITLLAAALVRMGMPPIAGIGHMGFIKMTIALLLIGINLSLFELLEKK